MSLGALFGRRRSVLPGAAQDAMPACTRPPPSASDAQQHPADLSTVSQTQPTPSNAQAYCLSSVAYWRRWLSAAELAGTRCSISHHVGIATWPESFATLSP